ncbi:hypothetical protein, partial [Cellulomonas sp. GbtcB1]|uniref:hypothetical protein n=1 Tax=Cellulomonas sp. GbtcB1 TaxID=2824746 RepID=UPI001C2F5633
FRHVVNWRDLEMFSGFCVVLRHLGMFRYMVKNQKDKMQKTSVVVNWRHLEMFDDFAMFCKI